MGKEEKSKRVKEKERGEERGERKEERKEEGYCSIKEFELELLFWPEHAAQWKGCAQD